MMRSLSKPFLIFLQITVLLTGCSLNKQDLQLAEEKANQVYDAISKQQFSTAALMYSPRFYERISKTDWIKILMAVQEKLGPYKSRKLVNQSVQRGFATISSTTIVLVYRVQYEKETTIEKLTMLRETPDSKTVDLLGHTIDFKQINQKQPSVSNK